MRVLPTSLLTIVFFSMTMSQGWCPEPVNLGTPLGPTGATGAAVSRPPRAKTYEDGQDRSDPKNMNRSERMAILGRERLAGRVNTVQEIKNLLQTGDPHLSYTPPPEKPLVKPNSLSDAQWQRVVSTPRPKTPDDVRGTFTGVGSGRTMQQNATANGGKLTPYVAPPTTAAQVKPPLLQVMPMPATPQPQKR